MPRAPSPAWRRRSLCGAAPRSQTWRRRSRSSVQGSTSCVSAWPRRRLDAALALGHHGDLVGELETLVAQQPSRERLRGQLMLALYRCGRQAEALAAYQEARRTLVDELGLEPGPELREFEAAILRQEPPSPSARGARAAPRPGTRHGVVGREQEVGEIVALLARRRAARDPDEPAGSGKTRLALQAAATSAESFGDGVFFVGLARARRSGARARRDRAGRWTTPRGSSTALEQRPARAPRAAAYPGQLRALRRGELVVGELLAEASGLKRPRDQPRRASRLRRARVSGRPLAVEEEAVELFCRPRPPSRRTFGAGRGHAELCRRLDCLPLAIELVATRTRELSPEDLASTSARLEAATGGTRDVPARHADVAGDDRLELRPARRRAAALFTRSACSSVVAAARTPRR